MCGIIGVYVNTDYRYQRLSRNLNHIFINQKHRGENGAGFSRLRQKQDFQVKKYLNPTDMLKQINQKKDFKRGDAWLLHHRIPTCTSNKEEFNHPLASDDGFISVIHNGVIWDASSYFKDYKDKLTTVEDKENEKYTDSELIRIILEEELRSVKKKPWHTNSVKKALKTLANKIKGRFAVAFTIKGDDKIWLFKNGNPIVLYDDNQGNHYFSSEYPVNYGAFTPLETKELIDGEIGCINADGYKTKGFLDKIEIEKMSSYNSTANCTVYNRNLWNGYDANGDYNYNTGSKTYDEWNKKNNSHNIKQEDLSVEFEDDEKEYPENYLPVEYDDLENKEVSDYLDNLNSRNIRKYTSMLSDIRKNMSNADTKRFVYDEVTCKGEHPLIKRYQFETIRELSESLKNDKIDKNTFLILSATIHKNFELAFRRILVENYNLLRLANICKAKSDVLKDCADYYISENFGEEEIGAFNYEVNKQFDEEARLLTKNLEPIETKYFKKPTRKESKAIKLGIKELFGEKHIEESVLVDTVKDQKIQDQIEKFEDNSVHSSIEDNKDFLLKGLQKVEESNKILNERMLDNEREFRAEQQYDEELRRLGYVRGN